ncbi:MAG: hypothetical protein Q7U88_12175 [Desulfocapsaceae bacterium]|nr:hypothetical protein [Desulfocapsaceae bacterium]
MIGTQNKIAPFYWRIFILQQQAPTQKAVIAGFALSVPAEDYDKFVKFILEEFANLHEGNAIRFGVSPKEFAVWQEKIK